MTYKEKTIQAYDEHTEHFSQNFTNLLDFENRYEFKHFEEFVPSGHILDMGCGFGEHSLYFQEKGFEVTAIDLSRTMVDKAKSIGVNAIIMDMEHMDLPQNMFDGIWAVTSLLHIPKDKVDKIFSDMHSLLKKDGILYVCVKEGIGEKIIKESETGAERFYSLWKEKELVEKAEKYFSLLESERTVLGETVFLKFFFKKVSV